MIEKPYEGRSIVNFDGIKLEIKIPSRKNWFIIIFLSVWMAGWFMGESFAINELFSGGNIGSDAFLLFWLAGWTVGGFFAITILLWSLFGQETLEIERGIFKISKGISEFKLYSKSYDSNSIKNFELNPEPAGMNSIFGHKKNMGDYFGFTGGKIRFDYGMKTIKFGSGIDEAEARYLIEEIAKRGFYKPND